MRIRLFLILAIAGVVFSTASCGDKEGPTNDISPEQKDPNAAHSGPKAVFIGDSITWQWGLVNRTLKESQQVIISTNPMPAWMSISGNNVVITWHASFFTKNDYVDKGVSAENTTQMLERYQKDVLSQDPWCVVIMGGTNDLAQGVSKEAILKNISSMAEQAAAKNMEVILCSVTPCNDAYSRLSAPNTKGDHILRLNNMIKAYAAEKGFTYCDYHPALVAADGLALKEAYWLYDHLHPNPDAYTVMEGIIKPIIDSLIQ